MTEIKVVAEIVNLRQARKRRDRAKKEGKAEENRLAYGRSKAERRQISAERDKAKSVLDDHKLDEPNGD